MSKLLEVGAEAALSWIEGVLSGEMEEPEDFNWELFHQMCLDYVSGYHREAFRGPRPDLIPVAERIADLLKRRREQHATNEE